MKFLINISIFVCIAMLCASSTMAACDECAKAASSAKASQQKLIYLMGSLKGMDQERGVINVDGWTIWINEDTEFGGGLDSLVGFKVWNTVYVRYYLNDQGKNIAVWLSKVPPKKEDDEE